MFGYNKPQLMAIVFCHKERGISVEEENHLVTVGIVKKSKTILVLLASPNGGISTFTHPRAFHQIGNSRTITLQLPESQSMEFLQDQLFDEIVTLSSRGMKQCNVCF